MQAVIKITRLLHAKFAIAKCQPGERSGEVKIRGAIKTQATLADISLVLRGVIGDLHIASVDKLFLGSNVMGRNLYILAATLGGLAIVSLVLSFTNVAQQPGSPGDASLWRVTSIALLCVALVTTLGGVLSTLFSQAERRAEEQRRARRPSVPGRRRPIE